MMSGAGPIRDKSAKHLGRSYTHRRVRVGSDRLQPWAQVLSSWVAVEAGAYVFADVVRRAAGLLDEHGDLCEGKAEPGAQLQFDQLLCQPVHELRVCNLPLLHWTASTYASARTRRYHTVRRTDTTPPPRGSASFCSMAKGHVRERGYRRGRVSESIASMPPPSSAGSVVSWLAAGTWSAAETVV